jgi:hypothetical protein
VPLGAGCILLLQQVALQDIAAQGPAKHQPANDLTTCTLHSTTCGNSAKQPSQGALTCWCLHMLTPIHARLLHLVGTEYVAAPEAEPEDGLTQKHCLLAQSLHMAASSACSV